MSSYFRIFSNWKIIFCKIVMTINILNIWSNCVKHIIFYIRKPAFSCLYFIYTIIDTTLILYPT